MNLKEIPADPWVTFADWLTEATKTNLRDPNAFTLSTVDAEGNPDSRIVLCKEVRPDGLVFYTNYHSAKGRQLEKNPVCAVNFFWDPLHRQVKMRGSTRKIAPEETHRYWRTRSRDSQLTQFVSQQSQPLASREDMQKAIEEAKAQFANQEIPCPPHWGGYLFVPHSIELWVGQPGRFHDRVLYTKVQNAWKAQRLYP